MGTNLGADPGTADGERNGSVLGTDSRHGQDSRQTSGRARSSRPQDVGAKASEQTAQAKLTQSPRVIDVLRSYTPDLLIRREVAKQVINVLSRILLCRTALLKGHVYECPICHSRRNVYNSCVDRHCPQCSGARRANWLEKTSELLLPKINYFQVIFTLPNLLSGLILGNRRALYDLLFHSAWRSLNEALRGSGQFQPAAHLVLHT